MGSVFNIYLVFLIKKYLFIYLWLGWVFTALQALLWLQSRTYSLVAVRGLLIVVPTLVAGAQGLSSCFSRALEHRLSSCGTWV